MSATLPWCPATVVPTAGSPGRPAVGPRPAQDGAALQTTMFRGAEVAYEVIDSLAIYAGDIILGTSAPVLRRR